MLRAISARARKHLSDVEAWRSIPASDRRRERKQRCFERRCGAAAAHRGGRRSRPRPLPGRGVVAAAAGDRRGRHPGHRALREGVRGADVQGRLPCAVGVPRPRPGGHRRAAGVRPASLDLRLHGQPPDLPVQRADPGVQATDVAAGRQIEQVPGAGCDALRRATGQALRPAATRPPPRRRPRCAPDGPRRGVTWRSAAAKACRYSRLPSAVIAGLPARAPRPRGAGSSRWDPWAASRPARRAAGTCRRPPGPWRTRGARRPRR